MSRERLDVCFANVDTKTGFFRYPEEKLGAGRVLVAGAYDPDKPLVVADSTVWTIDGVGTILHMVNYQDHLIPDGMQVVYLPASPKVVQDTFITETLSQARVVMLMGGEDPGPRFGTPSTNKPVRAYDQYNSARDDLNERMLNDIEKIERESGRPFFILAICRGHQLFDAAMLEDSSRLHYPEGMELGFNEHEVLHTDRLPKILIAGQDRFTMPSNHHVSIRALKNPTTSPWIPLYVAKDGVFEILVRVDSSGVVTGIRSQGHPEKMMQDREKSKVLQAEIRRFITEFRQAYP